MSSSAIATLSSSYTERNVNLSNGSVQVGPISEYSATLSQSFRLHLRKRPSPDAFVLSSVVHVERIGELNAGTPGENLLLFHIRYRRNADVAIALLYTAQMQRHRLESSALVTREGLER